MALLDHDGIGSRRQPHQRRPIVPDSSFRPVNDNRRAKPDRACELDCLIGLLPADVLRAAAMRAQAIHTGADRVLIASDAITETDYLHHLARHTGIAIETFADPGPADRIQLHDDQIAYAARSGLVPFRRDDDLTFVIAPRHLAARKLIHAVGNDPSLTARFRLATAADFDTLLLHGRNRALARDAAFGLRDRSPMLSAAPRLSPLPRRTTLVRIVASLGLAAILAREPGVAVDVCTHLLALWFIAAIGLRLVAAVMPQAPMPRWTRLRDADLPIYTIIVALYRERRVVPQLLRALDALDYPRERLDVIIATEADDDATRAAISQFGPMPHLRIMIAPDHGPRTKPKALNAALPFARGQFVAVFDAEDQPEPGQLRAALDVFRTGAPDIACAQAQLRIQNIGDSLFTRMFAAEYAGQFDAVLPGLAAMRLPLPLGGTSNHFRADALRQVGGWDAWNVTEDADLGLRLARFGYRAVTFASTTDEEAPMTFPNWLPQRTRWMKGWMQTVSVHLRDPRQMWRDAGRRGLVTLMLVLAAPIMSALAYPALLGCLAYDLVLGGDWLSAGRTPLHVVAVASGLLATAVIGIIGLAHRGRLRDGWILLLTPIYWGCLSIATYRALWQLLRDPYRWEKTEHGLARRTVMTFSRFWSRDRHQPPPKSQGPAAKAEGPVLQDVEFDHQRRGIPVSRLRTDDVRHAVGQANIADRRERALTNIASNPPPLLPACV